MASCSIDRLTPGHSSPKGRPTIAARAIVELCGDQTAMPYEHILYEVSERILTLTFNRPEQLNTVPFAMIDEMMDAVARADADDDIRVIIITANGRVFSGGTDLSGPKGGGFAPDDPAYKPLRGTGRDVGGELTIRMFDCKKPLIAAINGPAVGIGCSMILPVDIRIASDKARFMFPFVRRGIVPESCANWFLPRIVGISRALAWTITGRNITVEEALAAGFIQEIVPHDQLAARAREIALDIAVNTSAISVALTRQMMWKLLSADHPMEANRLESKALEVLVPGPDAREGVTAFKEKRAPNFQLKPNTDMPAYFPWWDDRTFES
jgi:enoyl-CoA hydratase/carnithine racemase